MTRFSEALKEINPEIYQESVEMFEEIMAGEAARTRELFSTIERFDPNPSMFDLFIHLGMALKASGKGENITTLCLRNFILGWSACMRYGDKHESG